MSLAFFLGLGFCLSGVNYLVPYFSRGEGSVYPGGFLFLGVLDLLTGVLMLTQLGLTAFMIPMVLAAWLVLAGAARVAISFRLRGLGFSKWWLMLLNGMVVVLLGCLMCASPMVAGLSVVMVLAWSLIAKGLLVILEARAVFAPLP